MSIVLDASAAVDLALGRPELTVFLHGQDLHVPAHFDIEVASALRGVQLRDEGVADDVTRARRAVSQMVVIRHPAPMLVERAWAIRGSLTIQDGVYVALAEGLSCSLLTTDLRLASTAEQFVDVIAPGR